MYRIVALLNGQPLPASNAPGFKPVKTRAAAERHLVSLDAYARNANKLLKARGKTLSYAILDLAMVAAAAVITDEASDRALAAIEREAEEAREYAQYEADYQSRMTRGED